MKISVFGTGFVGLTTGACLADLGHNILCVDVDEKKIEKLSNGEMPFYEPNLESLVSKNYEKGRLEFTTNVENGINFGEAIFNCVGTPTRDDGGADLSFVYQVAEDVGKFAEGYKVLINKSTVPPGTAKKCTEIIKKINPDSKVEVVSNPEFLKEGAAVHDFKHPDKIVIGTDSEQAFNLVKKAYMGRSRTYIPILQTDWETSEVIKYANNCFLATKISFINELANICDGLGADVKLVSQAMGLDYRINGKFLQAGTGYGGSCFPKDVTALIHTAEANGYNAKLLKEVDELNTRQKHYLINKLKEVYGSLEGLKLSLWGLSFKPQTSDIREAPSLVIVDELLKERVWVQAYDPIAIPEAKKTIGNKVFYCNSIESTVVDSDGIILVTEWDEFRNVNFSELGKKMRQKKVFDGRNIYEPEMIRDEGFEYFGVGRK